VETFGADVTAREAEVLALVGRHLTNVQIAEALFISVRTVESHVAALLRKCQLSDRRSLARLAAVESTPGRAPLPVPVTPFLGRAVERAELSAALVGNRLVTAVGPGGIGKTRLAINVAADVGVERGDGVWFVDLVRVTDPAAVVAAVVEAVGVPEQRMASPGAALVASLARRDGLVVLDNCEHLLEGVRDCVDLIVTGSSHVTVLATSRTRLMLPYERVYAVPGMSVTDDGGDAVALFAARVGTATGEVALPDGARVAALCRDLDGMALAIELAASRYSTLGLDGLEAGLHERLTLLSVGGRTGGRLRSLRDTIAWSYDLLAPTDQAVLRGVAVFASWFDVDAAHTVAAQTVATQTAAGQEQNRATVADALARLADHSLLVVDRGEPTRYRALETIRQYGEEQLHAAGELNVVQTRHEEWCRAALNELAEAPADDAWCVRLDRVVDDARVALLRCAAAREHDAQAGEMASQLAGLLWLRGRQTEAQRRYEQAAALLVSPEDQAQQLRMAAGAAYSRYVGTDVLRLLRTTADIALRRGDSGAAARDLAWMSSVIIRAPGIMADQHSVEEAVALLAEARAVSDGSVGSEAAIALATWLCDWENASVDDVERATSLAHLAGDGAVESAALDMLTAAHLDLADVAGAVRAVRRRDAVIGSLAMVAVNGFEHSDHHQYAAEVLLAAGDLTGAGEYADQLAGLPFNRGEDHLGLAPRLVVNAIAGHFDAVLQDGERFRRAWERAGQPVVPVLSRGAYAVATVHGILGHDGPHTEWVQLALALGVDPVRLAGCDLGWPPTFDALMALHRGDVGVAVDRLTVTVEDPDVWEHRPGHMWRAWYAAVWAEAAVLAGRDDAPDRIERARAVARDNPVAAAMVERAAAVAAGDRGAVQALEATFGTLGCPYQQQRTSALATSLAP
jgi:predicted ATPase/DNA-binding CsgD family transcriptional regulator